MTAILTADMLNISPNATPQHIASFNAALAYLSRSDTAVPIMLAVAASGTKINFVHGDQPDDGDTDQHIINWNPVCNAGLTNFR